MSSFEKLFEATTCYIDKINKACCPLFEFLNLSEFWYYKISNAGFKSYFGSNPAWTEYYTTEKLYLHSPFNCHPKFYCQDIYILKSVPDQAVSRVLKKSSAYFNIHPCFILIEQLPDGVEGFGFSSASSDEQQIALLLTELPLLRLFIQKFRSENQPLFSKLEEYKIDLVNLLGPVFYDNRLSVIPNRKVLKQTFLQKMGIECEHPLTPREVGVVKLLLEGYSAGKIAPQVYLSKRTVEHHIERIKEKLSCFSKAELIQKAREMEAFGSFKS